MSFFEIREDLVLCACLSTLPGSMQGILLLCPLLFTGSLVENLPIILLEEVVGLAFGFFCVIICYEDRTGQWKDEFD